MKQIFIINENSIGSKYGIGTYTQQLIACFPLSEWEVNVVELFSAGKQDLITTGEDGIRYFNIPMSQYYGDKKQYQKMNSKYYTTVFYFLLAYIQPKEVWFHFNFMHGYELATLLRTKLKAIIVLTVHYMDWSFELLGNRQELERMLSNPMNKKEENVKLSFVKERTFMQDCCDHIIAIARHSYQTLNELYKIPESQLAYIHNAMEDTYLPKKNDDLVQIRNHYMHNNTDKLIIFAGRLDYVKGLTELLEAFKLLVQENPLIHLIIAGDGSFSHYLEITNPIWLKVTFTGFIDKKQLFELYSIADLGIVPSLHEEFGYVALEMMMHKLPVIASNTTGLNEIVENRKSGITIDFNNKETRINSLKNEMKNFLYDDNLRNQCRKAGRVRFEEEYALPSFIKRIKQLYNRNN